MELKFSITKEIIIKMVSVLNSCESLEQVNSATNWIKTIIINHYRKDIKYKVGYDKHYVRGFYAGCYDALRIAANVKRDSFKSE